MEEKAPFVQPYRPSRIHTLFSWIDGLAGPYWLYYVGLVLVTGLLNQLVAWREHVLAPGEINWGFALSAFFLAYYLFMNDFLSRLAKGCLEEFRPILNATGAEYERIVFEFTYLPARETAALFFPGVVIGFVLAWHLLPTSPEMNQAFPEMELPIFALSIGVLFLSVYRVIRTFKLTDRLFRQLKAIDIYDQEPIYAMARYSASVIIGALIPTYLGFLLAPSLMELASYYFFLLLTIVYLAALGIFWVPLRGVNRTLVAEKRRLLKEANRRIKTTHELVHGRIDRQEFKDLDELQKAVAGLMKEKEFIESIRTWPWKPSTLTGLLSAVVLPLLGKVVIELVSNLIKP